MDKGKTAIIISLLLLFSVLLMGKLMTRAVVLTRDEPRVVLSFGQDLSQAQRQEMEAYFKEWQGSKEAQIITVSNEEEHRYLAGLVEEGLIGSRAISSVYCELLAHGQGLEVKTKNIEAITPFMYANALTTAGIEDARVIAAAPVKVSGTAALTGMIKSFEQAKGEPLQEKAKETAHEEVARTSELGKKVGQGNAETVIYEVKRQVLSKKVTDPEQIRAIILKVSADLKVELAEKDIEHLVQLMLNIQGLNLNINRLSGQLKNLNRDISEVRSTGRMLWNLVQEWLQKIRQGINAMGERLT
ncbi:MAG: DUF1002 domain-containing protein [Syntrophomonadaceae bacterium]